jgi:hypothetical protein
MSPVPHPEASDHARTFISTNEIYIGREQSKQEEKHLHPHIDHFFREREDVQCRATSAKGSK